MDERDKEYVERSEELRKLTGVPLIGDSPSELDRIRQETERRNDSEAE